MHTASLLSGNPMVAETCAEQCHQLREYMLEQTEAEGIQEAID